MKQAQQLTIHNAYTFDKNYSSRRFWKKLQQYAAAAGDKLVFSALTLFYAFKSPDTPAWAKGIIVAALGYFVAITDAIPDLIPAAGYTDDYSVLLVAMSMVAMSITPDIKEQARQKMRDWFEPVPA